jgi:hypothetical protein
VSECIISSYETETLHGKAAFPCSLETSEGKRVKLNPGDPMSQLNMTLAHTYPF